MGYEKYKHYGGYIDYVGYENRGGSVSVNNAYIIVIRRFTKIGVQKPASH